MSTVAAPEAPAVTRPVTGADALERAAYLLVEEIVEWAQAPHVAHDLNRYCLASVVGRAEGRGKGDAYYVSSESLRALGVEHSTDLWDWNDEVGRTKADVVARLLGAAQRERTPD